MKELMRVKDVARLLSFHPMTVYKLLQSREIPATHVGGQWIVVRELLMEWIRDRSKRREG